MTIKELGQQYKQKYPQYKNIDDETIGKKVLEKYPVYKSKITDLSEEKNQSIETTEKKQTLSQKAGQFLLGAAKGVASTVKGISSIGEKTLGRVVGAYKGGETSAEQLQSSIENKLGLKQGSITQPTNKYQKAGKFTEQVAEFAIPGTKVSKLTSASNLGTKLLTRGLTSGAVATAQSGKIGKESAIAAGTEVSIPIAGKILKPLTTDIIKRLTVGLGSGLSGVSTDTLKSIASNPKTAITTSKKILTEGQESVLRNNAKTIVNGVSQIRQEARKLYGEGLEKLSEVDIKPEIIVKNSLSALEKNGVKVTDKGFNLSQSEILNDTIKKRAKNILSQINEKTTSNGKEIKTLMDKIESSKFKTALTDPDRKSFNILMDDLSEGLRNSIDESTNKLKEINLKYSTDMSLSQGVERIFGKIKFKNRVEIDKVAKKLEGLFSQSGLDPQTTNDFLTRIGINPSKFKTTEAVRNIMNKTTGTNTKGLSVGEITQQLTSSVITPNAVKNIAITTGLAENVIKNIIKYTAPSGRAIIIKSLINK